MAPEVLPDANTAVSRKCRLHAEKAENDLSPKVAEKLHVFTLANNFHQQLCCASKWAKMEPMDKNQHEILHKKDTKQDCDWENFPKQPHVAEFILCAP